MRTNSQLRPITAAVCVSMQVGCTESMWRVANEREVTIYGMASVAGQREVVVYYVASLSRERYAVHVPLTACGRPVAPFGAGKTGSNTDLWASVDCRRRADITTAADRLGLAAEAWYGEPVLQANAYSPDGGQMSAFVYRMDGYRRLTLPALESIRFGDKRGYKSPGQLGVPSDAFVLILPRHLPRPEPARSQAQLVATALTPATVATDVSLASVGLVLTIAVLPIVVIAIAVNRSR